MRHSQNLDSRITSPPNFVLMVHSVDGSKIRAHKKPASVNTSGLFATLKAILQLLVK